MGDVWIIILTIVNTLMTAAIVFASIQMVNARKVIEAKLAVFDYQMKPIWRKVQAVLAKELHHPDDEKREMDQLLEKLEGWDGQSQIDPAETFRLQTLLTERSLDMRPEISDSERASAKIMAIVMEKVLEETASATG